MAASTTGMHNLTTLIKRLEAATSRLEDIASSSQSSDGVDTASARNAAGSASAPELPAMANSAPTPPVNVAAPPAEAPKPSLPPAIEALDELADSDLKKFLETAKDLDKNIADQAEAVARAFNAQRTYLLISTKAKKPDMTSSAFADLIKDLQQEMSTVTEIKESNRASPFKDQLAMVAEGMGALQWVVFEGKPADYVGEVLGGVQLFGNRVLKEYKEKDQKQVGYVQSYYSLWKNLQAYIRKHYPTGVTWNNNGSELTQALKDVSAAPTPASASAPAPPGGAGGPPPPPPPPPLPTFDNPPPPPPAPAASSAAAGGDMGAVFDQLNKGEAVTAGLRKVDRSEMTHKNPSLRAAAVVPQRSGSADGINRSRSPAPQTKPKPESIRGKGLASPVAKKEGKKELDGNKWIIENFEDPAAPIEVEVSLAQSILISRCKNTTIRLIGKANAISLDNCARTNLVIDSLVSSVDVIKCSNFALQVLGALPTVLLDQVDGAAVYLSKDSLHTELFTSKCTSININLPPVSEEDDYAEVPLPEQIRSVIKGGKIVSEIVEHAG
ncbi:hypothetical protein AAFC00_002197 [Neodothiora populina]|uniref:Adenylyl cyclase-associated protein n=1 Tax=Neodothiora populina TaxID=2781224 RepID=A0ABR3PGM1_9PEZI